MSPRLPVAAAIAAVLLVPGAAAAAPAPSFDKAVAPCPAGRTVTVPAPLGRPPVFYPQGAKAGATLRRAVVR